MRRPKLGQVFLTDINIIQKILQSVAIKPTDTVIEIGCGDGILTEAIQEELPCFTVIEIDQTCIDRTQKRLNGPGQITWIHDDALNINFQDLGPNLRIVANIPYYISSPLIQRFAYAKEQFADITLMVQKEFAQKAIGGPGQGLYTPLSVFMQFHFNVSYCFTVSKTCFKPVPKIDSAIIKLTPKPSDARVDPAFFETVVKACFWGKRKKLSTALNKNPHLNLKNDVRSVPEIAHFMDKRADQLSVGDYVELVIGMVGDRG